MYVVPQYIQTQPCNHTIQISAIVAKMQVTLNTTDPFAMRNAYQTPKRAEYQTDPIIDWDLNWI